MPPYLGSLYSHGKKKGLGISYICKHSTKGRLVKITQLPKGQTGPALRRTRAIALSLIYRGLLIFLIILYISNKEY